VKTKTELLARLRSELPRLQSRYAIDRLSLFGSFARDEQAEGSDVDLLVTFAATPNLWQFIDLRDELSAALGLPVDLVSQKGVKPAVLERIRSEEVLV
jgi:predicted nucleotidyltransferase